MGSYRTFPLRGKRITLAGGPGVQSKDIGNRKYQAHRLHIRAPIFGGFVPWKESNDVTERMKFITRFLEGDKITELSKEFGISRKTAYKIINRFKEDGPSGLYNKPKAPLRVANRTPKEVEKLILCLKHDKPSWGAAKIRELFLRKYPNIFCPCKSTVHSILDQNELTKRRRARTHRHKAQGTFLSVARQPNDLWCADFKGHFRLGNQKYCYPLTVTDQFSRYLFSCEALESVKPREAISVFERVFKDHGLPQAIRTDNGVPFSHPQALHGLTPLSVWWLRQGIKLERITPGCPEQNGRHERMHRTLKSWMGRSKGNFLQQQESLDEFLEEFNTERPHEALGMKTPAEVHTPSRRKYQGLQDDLVYSLADTIEQVNLSGEVLFKKKRIYISRSFAGYNIGITEQEEDIYLVHFMDYELGFFDLETRKVLSVQNPFVLPKV